MKLATWNVNSLKVRLPHVLDWLQDTATDVLCLQETKLDDPLFPQAEIEAAGYHVAFSGQKTYNGVALISRKPIADVSTGNPNFPDPQKRLIAGTIDGIRIISAYVPNGQSVGSDKYEYKLAWLDALIRWLEASLTTHPKLIIAGDYNIAPTDEDVHDPAAWVGQVLVSPEERAAFQRLLALGLSDVFRQFDQPGQSYSWWDYRMGGFRRNRGMRIDHILATSAVSARCHGSHIDRAPRTWERPSDHTPVVAEFGVNTDA
jgi:exodeoxyribonuclease-3